MTVDANPAGDHTTTTSTSVQDSAIDNKISLAHRVRLFLLIYTNDIRILVAARGCILPGL